MHNRSRNHTLLIILVTILVFLFQMASWSPIVAQNSVVEHVAVILILDDSGSMKASDSTNLRYTAAQLFVALLDEGDAVGALHFSSTSRPITQGVEAIASSGDKIRLIDQLTAPVPEGFTDMKAAFEEAQQMRQTIDETGYRPVVIFLTDGKPEIPQPYSGYEDEALQAAHNIGTPILSISLTSAARSSFLNRVSSETGGRVIFANEASDLLDIYLQILGEIKDRTVIGSGSVSSPDQAEISLDPALTSYIDRVSFVISKPASVNAELISPDGKTIQAVNPLVTFSVQDQRFAAYSLPQPPGGNWRFQLSGSGAIQARAILYARLRTRLVSPSGIFEAGLPLPLVVKLIEEQPGLAPVNIIGDASFSAHITRPDGVQDSLDRFYDDGTHGDALAGDGNFTRLYVNTNQPGIYQVKIQGYKGVVPVTYQTQIQGIALPVPMVDQPSALRYDIRSNAIPLEIHLTGADPIELDHGNFIALITSPDGNSQQIHLQRNGSVFKSEFSPTQDGYYQARFQPVDATYQGLPYQKTLETKFEATIIPTLSVIKTQLGLQPATGRTARFEVSQALQGIPVIVTFSSTSSRNEVLFARLETMPGFSLVEGGDLSISPNNNTTLTLHIKAEAGLQPQTAQGKLIFSSGGGVDLVGQEIPLNLEVFTPALTILPGITSNVSPDTCLTWAPVQLELQLNSTSLQNEQIRVHLEDIPGASLDREMVNIQPGSSRVKLTILPGDGQFAAGDYTGRLIVAEARSGLKVSPETTFRLTFKVDPLWVTCRKPMIISGVVLAFGIILIATLISRAHRKAQPPVVTGTLIHWNKDDPDATAMDVDLTAKNKTEVKIGKGSQNDVVIPDDTAVQDEHVVIIAKRDENGEPFFTLHPIAKMRKGYREDDKDLPLEENVEYQIGNRKFKYIRDIQL